MSAKKQTLTRKQLEQEQARNLKFIETWSEAYYQKVLGVNVIRALAYELIQLLNIQSEKDLVKEE